MTLRVDLDRREIVASIGDLVEIQREAPRGAGLLGRVRTALGIRIHQRYREERERTGGGFAAEVEVGFEHRTAGFSTRLSGRVDGLIEAADRLVVEEVKSVELDGASLARARAELFPDFVLQLRLYGLALTKQRPGRHIEARLILVSLLDETRREMTVDLQPSATSARLDELLQVAIARAEKNRQTAHQRQALAHKIRFPYPEMRPYQDELIETVQAGLSAGRPVLLLAPTGIGKTVAALYAGLRDALARDAVLVFLTAKTTQQRLVERTFEDLCTHSGLKPAALRCLTLRAKEKMCPPGHLLCHPLACPLLEEFHGRAKKARVDEQLLSSAFCIEPEAIQAAGEAHRLCPFALSLTLIPKVVLVIGDYNYLYDPALALGGLIGAEADRPAVVIVDEAHNLFDRARGYYSPFIAKTELRSLAVQIEQGAFSAEPDRSQTLPLLGLSAAIDAAALFERVRRLVADVDAAIDATLANAERSEQTAVEDCRPAELDPEDWRLLADRAASLLVEYALYCRVHQLIRARDPLIDLLARLGRLRDVLALRSSSFVPYAAGPMAPQGAGLGCLCVNPADRLAEQHRRSQGVVAMSATLSPLSYYSDVLGLSELDPVAVALPSPFPEENLGVWIAPEVRTTFRQRDRDRAAVAGLIRQTVSARSGRYVAFFPSFQYLGAVRAELGLPAEQVMIQLPGMSDAARQRLLDRFRHSDGPRLLLAVMGGVFAEGVDLPGEELIGALVVGPGLPQVGFERAAMQHYFEKTYEQGFAYAMLYPGMQRVIQSAGRVIRTPEDRGVIVLLGRRFAEPEMAACLPPHWYRYSPAELVSDDLPASLAAFWRSAVGPT